MDIQEITQQVEKEIVVVRRIRAEIEKVVVGQRELIDRMLIGLLCDGHILIEGLPGLAKTTAVKTLAATIRTSFQRIQFTPDLLPADILGTQIYRPDTATFEIKKGPIFHNIILADEINRAPAKVQSALLEAMQERQVTIGQQTFALAEPFLVLATQNPIEHEGTYPAPRGADRPLHDEDQGRLPLRGGGENDHGAGLRGGRRPGGRRGRVRAGRRGEPDHENDPHGREGRGLHHPPEFGHAEPEGVRPRHRAADQLRRLPARLDLARSRRPGLRLPERARVRDAPGRQVAGPGRPAPPDPAELRGGGRGPDHGRPDQDPAGADRGA